MDKLKMHSPDLTDENIAKIRDIFPDCVTEAKDENGNLRLAVDFDQLRQTLSDSIVEGPQERYRLDWPGKREALLTANAPIAKTLRPCREESVDFDTTQNLFIEGDNLDALKLLQETYLGKVKMIYIDPPYNTGNDFIYEDNFSETSDDFFKKSNQKDDAGNQLVANQESNGRFHSDWLSFIYPRLKLARNLLSDDGVCFVSIGQDEVSNLKRLCDEIYGEENFVSLCSRVMKTGGQKGVHFSPCIDYILIYAKNIGELNQFREPISQNVIEKVYTKVASDGPRKGEKYRAMGLYQAMLDKRANQRFYIECPDGSLVIPPGQTYPNVHSEGEQVAPSDGDGVWRWTFDRYRKEALQENIEFVKSARSSLVHPDGSPAGWNVYYKIWLIDRMKAGQLPGNILEKFQSRHSSAELKALNIPFDFAKPSALIKYLMTLVSIDSDDIVLDYFAGSASTAHAVLEYNAESKTQSKFVCVQLPEDTHEKSAEYKEGYRTIAEISKERIRRSGSKIKETFGALELSESLDIGFRVLKIDTSNMADVYYTPEATKQDYLLAAVDNIKPGRDNPEDLLFQVLVDWGVDLTLPIRKDTIQDKTVFFVNHEPYDLIACFDKGITEELVKELATFKPVRVVFRDNSFVSDAVKINVDQIFRQLSPATDVKSI